jgi:hypothetical protein
MTIHRLDFEFKSDFYDLNTPATLELETDERQVSRDPNDAYEEFVTGYRVLCKGAVIGIPIEQQKLNRLLRDYLASEAAVLAEERALANIQNWSFA